MISALYGTFSVTYLLTASANETIWNAASEISTYYHYMLLRINLIGIDGEYVKEIISDIQCKGQIYLSLFYY